MPPLCHLSTRKACTGISAFELPLNGLPLSQRSWQKSHIEDEDFRVPLILSIDRDVFAVSVNDAKLRLDLLSV
jgi:hypothetical protein